MLPLTRYYQSILTLTFKMAKVKCKYANQELRYDFLLDDNYSNVRSISTI